MSNGITSLQITAASITQDGKTLVTAESENIFVWNFPLRAILSCTSEPDVASILFTADEKRFLTVCHKAAPDTDPSILVVCRNVPLADLVYTFEFYVKNFLPVGKYVC